MMLNLNLRGENEGRPLDDRVSEEVKGLQTPLLR